MIRLFFTSTLIWLLCSCSSISRHYEDERFMGSLRTDGYYISQDQNAGDMNTFLRFYMSNDPKQEGKKRLKALTTHEDTPDFNSKETYDTEFIVSRRGDSTIRYRVYRGNLSYSVIHKMGEFGFVSDVPSK